MSVVKSLVSVCKFTHKIKGAWTWAYLTREATPAEASALENLGFAIGKRKTAIGQKSYPGSQCWYAQDAHVPESKIRSALVAAASAPAPAPAPDLQALLAEVDEIENQLELLYAKLDKARKLVGA